MTNNNLNCLQWLLIVIIGLLVLLGIPYFLNHFIQQPQRFEIVGEGKDWLLFWSAWLSAVASFAMVFFTWRTLSQNKEQLDELKRQWEDQNRPYLQIKFIKKRKSGIGYFESNNDYAYYMRVTNIGNSTAAKILILMGSHSIFRIEQALGLSENIISERAKDYIKLIKEIITPHSTTVFDLSKGESIDRFFMDTDLFTNSLNEEDSELKEVKQRVSELFSNDFAIIFDVKYGIIDNDNKRIYDQKIVPTFTDNPLDTPEAIRELINIIQSK